ncbi:MAG: PEP-CTERM sorting domain-containing protein [Betaproteobacteria bacterium]
MYWIRPRRGIDFHNGFAEQIFGPAGNTSGDSTNQLPVPEAETFAMLAVGLGVLVIVGRGRRKL